MPLRRDAGAAPSPPADNKRERVRPSSLTDPHRHKHERLKRNLDERTYRLAKRMGKAINDYQMIKEGDRVLVAVSGGKDSITLLHLLALRLIWLPVRYDLVAVHVLSDMRCPGCAHPETMSKLFAELGVEHHFEHLGIKKHLATRGLQMNCYRCATGRRKILFEAALKYRCNRLALGHHLDDIAHTIMMNLFIHGKVSGMDPKVELFKGTLTLIRPLAYVHESETAEYVKKINFPSHLCQCPHAAKNVRRTMKEAVELLRKACRWPEVNAFRALYGEGPGDKPARPPPDESSLE